MYSIIIHVVFILGFLILCFLCFLFSLLPMNGLILLLVFFSFSITWYVRFLSVCSLCSCSVFFRTALRNWHILQLQCTYLIRYQSFGICNTGLLKFSAFLTLQLPIVWYIISRSRAGQLLLSRSFLLLPFLFWLSGLSSVVWLPWCYFL